MEPRSSPKDHCFRLSLERRSPAAPDLAPDLASALASALGESPVSPLERRRLRGSYLQGQRSDTLGRRVVWRPSPAGRGGGEGRWRARAGAHRLSSPPGSRSGSAGFARSAGFGRSAFARSRLPPRLPRGLRDPSSTGSVASASSAPSATSPPSSCGLHRSTASTTARALSPLPLLLLPPASSPPLPRLPWSRGPSRPSRPSRPSSGCVAPRRALSG